MTDSQTYPRVRRPDLDRCVNDDGRIGYVWISTEDGDRPVCEECFRTIILPTEIGTPDVTTNHYVSQWGNVYRTWSESDHERVADITRREDGCTCEDEDECTCATGEDVSTSTSTGDTCGDECQTYHTLTSGCAVSRWTDEAGTVITRERAEEIRLCEARDVFECAVCGRCTDDETSAVVHASYARCEARNTDERENGWPYGDEDGTSVRGTWDER